MQDREPVEIEAFGRPVRLLRCFQEWDDMAPTDDPQVRHCHQCATNVRRVAGAEDFEAPERCVSLCLEEVVISGEPLYG